MGLGIAVADRLRFGIYINKQELPAISIPCLKVSDDEIASSGRHKYLKVEDLHPLHRMQLKLDINKRYVLQLQQQVRELKRKVKVAIAKVKAIKSDAAGSKGGQGASQRVPRMYRTDVVAKWGAKVPEGRRVAITVLTRLVVRGRRDRNLLNRIIEE